MNSTENAGGGMRSGDHALPDPGCVASQPPERSTARTAVGFAAHGPLADDPGDAFREWTVVAVHLDAGQVGLLPIGVVIAADLDLAAGQVCDRVPAPGPVTGAHYLVASSCALEVDQLLGRIVTVPQASWVNRMHWAGEAWVPGEWLPAVGGLGMLDPRRWRATPRRGTAP
ncbi:hypothetical protein ACFVUS_40990 [Nocardia sp. NPDC058058]|uniref:hypothetical protein n=1 Tax=Nocardia sp. NPDC058058 TaxID=3346317 RepID=UPI0036DD3316